MDTSDGLGDAIYKISKASNCFLNIDNIPVSDILKETFPDEWENFLEDVEEFSNEEEA